MTVNFGTLLEILEDWIRNDLSGNRIVARIVDGKEVVEAIIDGAYFVEEHNTIYLVVRRKEQDDLFDNFGNLLNDQTPEGIYKDLKELEEGEVDFSTPIEIEIWFSDGGDDIQYRIGCHEYHIGKNELAMIHFLGSEEEDKNEDEFKNLLHEQY